MELMAPDLGYTGLDLDNSMFDVSTANTSLCLYHLNALLEHINIKFHPMFCVDYAYNSIF